MSAVVLEIVELEEGGYVLRQSDAKEQAPMISIQFSKQAIEEFDGQQQELARSMIALGVKLMVESRGKQLLESLKPILH
tara:strand:- start:6076 stop:6312 length:237 start_codon:yes stop_codon:yes gene_type:complete